jgi:hypothetical protein
MHREPGRIDDAAYYKMVIRKHDARIASAPFDVTASRRIREIEALKCDTSRNDRMIDRFDAVVHAPLCHCVTDVADYISPTAVRVMRQKATCSEPGVQVCVQNYPPAVSA